MLSSQTKDEVNYAAMNRLKEFGLTPEKIAEASVEELGKLIYPVGFWKVRGAKTSYAGIQYYYCGVSILLVVFD